MRRGTFVSLVSHCVPIAVVILLGSVIAACGNSGAHESRETRGASEANKQASLQFTNHNSWDPEEHPDAAIAHMNLGFEYQTRGELDRAIAEYNEAIRLDPEFALAYLNRGNAYLTKGQMRQAIADYEEALRLDPELTYAYIGRGNVHLMNGDLDRAMADYNEAVRLDPEFALAYFNRGNAFLAIGSFARAITDFNQALRLDPEYVPANANRGRAYLLMGEPDLAIRDFTQALSLWPEEPVTWEGPLTAAFLFDSSNAGVPPSKAPIYALRGLSYVAKGRFDLAIQDFDQALELDPQLVDVYLLRSAAHLENGNPLKAREDMAQYLDAGGNPKPE